MSRTDRIVKLFVTGNASSAGLGDLEAVQKCCLSLNQSSGSWGSEASPVTSALDVSSLTGTGHYIHLSNTQTVGGSAQ